MRILLSAAVLLPVLAALCAAEEPPVPTPNSTSISTAAAAAPGEKAPSGYGTMKVVPDRPVPSAQPVMLHTVWLWQESRDCLWNLAKKYYGDPWQWKKIYLANRNQIEDPGVIYPKQVLVIPPPDEPEKRPGIDK